MTSETGERQWIVVEHQSNPVEAAIVSADTEQEAAEAGATFLYEEATERADYRDLPVTAPTHVFVAPWDGRVAYVTDFVARAALAEHQCCGGGPHAKYVNGSGHWGGCPQSSSSPAVASGADE